MIAHLQGKLVEKNPTEVIIDCNGVGYHVNISLHTYSLLPNSEAIKLFTYLQIKEDSHTLFGFVEKSEREIFNYRYPFDRDRHRLTPFSFIKLVVFGVLKKKL